MQAALAYLCPRGLERGMGQDIDEKTTGLGAQRAAIQGLAQRLHPFWPRECQRRNIIRQGRIKILRGSRLRWPTHW